MALSVPDPGQGWVPLAAQLMEQSSIHFTGNSSSRRLTFWGVQENPSLDSTRLRTRAPLGSFYQVSCHPVRTTILYMCYLYTYMCHGEWASMGGAVKPGPFHRQQVQAPDSHQPSPSAQPIPRWLGGGDQTLLIADQRNRVDPNSCPPWGCTPGGQGQAPTHF